MEAQKLPFAFTGQGFSMLSSFLLQRTQVAYGDAERLEKMQITISNQIAIQKSQI